MSNNISRVFATAQPRSLSTLIVLSIFLLGACRHAKTEQQVSVAVNAPSTGTVRVLLVEGGTSVDKDTVIMQLGIPVQQSGIPQEKPEQDRAVRAARLALTAADSEASRTTREVQRIEPLVKKGIASQQELNEARGKAEASQERLRLAREKVNLAESNRNQPSTDQPKEEIVSIRAPARGTVEFEVKAGQHVSSGEPIARLFSHS